MDQSRRVLEEYYNDSNESYACPSWAPTVGFIGIACAVCFASKYCTWLCCVVLFLFIFYVQYLLLHADGEEGDFRSLAR